MNAHDCLVDMIRQLGQIVHSQNGNRYADIPALLEQAKDFLDGHTSLKPCTVTTAAAALAA